MFCLPSESKAKHLQEIELKIVSNDTCQNISDSFAIFEDEKIDFYEEGIFCAGGEKGKDSCTGDSGSPLWKWVKGNGNGNIAVQIGIVSRGIGCARYNRAVRFLLICLQASKYNL